MIWIQSNSLKELTVHIKQVSRDEPKMLFDRSKHLKKIKNKKSAINGTEYQNSMQAEKILLLCRKINFTSVGQY